MAPVWQCSRLSGRPNLYSGFPLSPSLYVAQDECWTYGCSPSGNSHGTLIICVRKEPLSRIVWMNVCIRGVFALSFGLLFLFFPFSPLCHLHWSDTVWPEWAKLWAKWNCLGRQAALPFWKLKSIACIPSHCPTHLNNCVISWHKNIQYLNSKIAFPPTVLNKYTIFKFYYIGLYRMIQKEYHPVYTVGKITIVLNSSCILLVNTEVLLTWHWPRFW